MKRAILLQTNSLTKAKQELLKRFSREALNLANNLLKQRKTRYLMDLHRKTYSLSKTTASFNSQVICDIERNVVKTKGSRYKYITVKFNIPRNCKTFNTKANFFVELGMYPRRRVAIPIKQNRNYQRYISLLSDGWECKTYGLTSNGQIVAHLTKEDTTFPRRKNMLGIDINSKYFAVSVVTPKGKVLKQTYFGKDIWVKRKKIFERREELQSLADRGSHRARQSLKKLKKVERNFVKNRLGEVVKQIIEMALHFDADIAVESLKRFKPKGKRFNKKVMRIPFYKFKQLLESRCYDKKITINVMDSWHTSKWCTHCGAVGNGHSANYSLFKCKECRQVVNSDRKASLAIAVKSLLERRSFQVTTKEFFQISNRQVSVNGLLRSDDGVDVCAVHNASTPMESPLR